MDVNLSFTMYSYYSTILQKFKYPSRTDVTEKEPPVTFHDSRRALYRVSINSRCALYRVSINSRCALYRVSINSRCALYRVSINSFLDYIYYKKTMWNTNRSTC